VKSVERITICVLQIGHLKGARELLQEFGEQKLCVDAFLDVLIELVVYEEITLISESHIQVIGPLVVEVLLHLPLELYVQLLVIIKFLQSIKKPVEQIHFLELIIISFKLG
jgi:hypothetical protein